MVVVVKVKCNIVELKAKSFKTVLLKMLLLKIIYTIYI